jgi:cullin 3
MSTASKPSFKFTSTISRLKMDNSAVTNQLRVISNAMDTIYQRSSSQLSFNDIYGTAYNLVLQKQGDALYERIRETLETHLQISVKRILSTNPSNFLPVLVQEWVDHKTAFESITRVLMYMDRTYCEQKKKNG